MGVPPHHRFYPEPEAPARPPCPGLLLYLLMGRRLRLAPLSRPLAGQTSSLLTSGLSFGIRSEHGGCVQGVAICRAIPKNFASTPRADIIDFAPEVRDRASILVPLTQAFVVRLSPPALLQR